MEDTKKILDIISKEYNNIVNTENTSNALDFIQEIIDNLQAIYFVNDTENIKNDLYNMVKKGYNVLDNLTKRLQDNYNDNIEFEQCEEDRIVLGNILDIMDGQKI